MKSISTTKPIQAGKTSIIGRYHFIYPEFKNNRYISKTTLLDQIENLRAFHSNDKQKKGGNL